MNIMITGAKCFVAKELMPRFSGNNIIATTRETLNLFDTFEVDRFFNENKIDVVIHAAIMGGKRHQVEDPFWVYNNMIIFENLVRNRSKFGMMFSFGSGAEFDRRLDINDLREISLGRSIPTDYYGFSKYLIGRRILDIDSNVINLRVLSLFGNQEDYQRYIKTCVRNYILKNPMKIFQNKMMDFFHIEDLYRVISYYINSTDIPYVDMNVVYPKKKSLLDIANYINTLSDYKVDIEIQNEGVGNSYTGDGTKLQSLGIKLRGLEEGIKDMYDYLRQLSKI